MNQTKPRIIALQVLLVIFYVTGLAWADSITFPLQGYYHPGRTMPVAWEIAAGNTGTQSLVVSADGAATSRIDRIDSPRGIVPWLIYDSDPRNIRCQTANGSDIPVPVLRALDPSDRLVATFADDDALAKDLFPNQKIITIHLGAQHPFGGPASAWETLDAIILTPDAFNALSQSTLNSLYMAGVKIALKGYWPSNPWLPYTQMGSLSVADIGIKMTPLISPEVDRPTEGWVPGRSTAFRRRIFLLGLTFCLLMAGISLWRSRWMPVVIVVVSAAAFVFFDYGNQSQSPIAVARGSVVIDDPSGSVVDQWIFQQSHRQIDFQTPWDESSFVVFGSEAQLAVARLWFQYDQDGSPRNVSGILQADMPLAFVTRRWEPSIGPPIAGTVAMNSPLRLLAGSSIYSGFHVAEQRPDTTPAGWWPTVVLRRTKPQP